MEIPGRTRVEFLRDLPAVPDVAAVEGIEFAGDEPVPGGLASVLSRCGRGSG